MHLRKKKAQLFVAVLLVLASAVIPVQPNWAWPRAGACWPGLTGPRLLAQLGRAACVRLVVGASVERCWRQSGLLRSCLTEEGGAGSADRLTANRWLSGSALWLFVGQVKGL